MTETPAGLSDARYALALVERLPRCRDALYGLARARQKQRRLAGITDELTIDALPPGA